MAKTKEILLEQERVALEAKPSGSLLSYDVWGCRQAQRNVVTRYNLAYINHDIYAGENGRVLGLDNAHGYHHGMIWNQLSRSNLKVTRSHWIAFNKNGRM